jgi:hypothetical protein
MNFRRLYRGFWRNLDSIVKNSKLSRWIGKNPLKIGLRVEFSKTQGLICKGNVTCSLNCGLIFRKHKGLYVNDQCPMVVDRGLIFLKPRGSFVKCHFGWRWWTWHRRFENPMTWTICKSSSPCVPIVFFHKKGMHNYLEHNFI